ncbi:hypothetical protein [Schlesneria sp. T3-172]|uniref:hypothetical protein n=1 Tax=Schlesneria sphaerica TaxID=3373610 RepID=UPI0037C83F2F
MHDSTRTTTSVEEETTTSVEEETTTSVEEETTTSVEEETTTSVEEETTTSVEESILRKVKAERMCGKRFGDAKEALEDLIPIRIVWSNQTSASRLSSKIDRSKRNSVMMMTFEDTKNIAFLFEVEGLDVRAGNGVIQCIIVYQSGTLNKREELDGRVIQRIE